MRFGTIPHPTQLPGSWTPLKGRTVSDGGYRDATSPSPTNTCSKTDASLKVGGKKKKRSLARFYVALVLLSPKSHIYFFFLFFFFLIETVKPPLSFLFEDKTHSSFSSTVKDKATSESIRYNILLLSSCNPLSEHVMSGCKKNVILLSIGSPDVASALPLPEKQQGSYFWVRHRPLFTRSSITCSLWGTAEYCSSVTHKRLLFIH